MFLRPHSRKEKGINVLGPFALESWQDCPSLTNKDRKAFWGKRRVAVGGPTIEAGDDDKAEAQDSDSELDKLEEGEEEKLELPDVGSGTGRGTCFQDHVVQPINYHQLPPATWESIIHMVWGSSVIDLTPQQGISMSFYFKNAGHACAAV